MGRFLNGPQFASSNFVNSNLEFNHQVWWRVNIFISIVICSDLNACMLLYRNHHFSFCKTKLINTNVDVACMNSQKFRGMENIEQSTKSNTNQIQRSLTMLVRQLEKISPANLISIGLRGLYCFQSELSLISKCLYSTGLIFIWFSIQFILYCSNSLITLHENCKSEALI